MANYRLWMNTDVAKSPSINKATLAGLKNKNVEVKNKQNKWLSSPALWVTWSTPGPFLTCDVEILDWSWRAVRSEDDTLAGAPRWSRMLTFLSRSAREIARGDVLPKTQ